MTKRVNIRDVGKADGVVGKSSNKDQGGLGQNSVFWIWQDLSIDKCSSWGSLHKTYTSSRQSHYSTEWEELKSRAIIDRLWFLGDGESIFFKGVVHGRLTVFLQMALHHGIRRWHKLD